MDESNVDADVLIVGGGPGGLALSATLQSSRLSSIVLERRTQAECAAQRSSGYDMSPSGVKALKRMDLLTFIKKHAISHSGDEILICDAAKGIISSIKTKGIAQFGGEGLITIQRAHLIAALTEGQEDPSKVEWGVSVVEVGAGGPEELAWARLSDGRVLRAKVLVGADGIHSRVRKSLFGDTGVQSRGEIGFWCMLTGDGISEEMRALVDGPDGADFRGKEVFIMGEGIMGILMLGEHHLFWFVSTKLPKPFIAVPPEPKGGWKSFIAQVARCAKAAPLLEKLVLATRPDDILSTMAVDRDPLDTYTRDRCILIGDAAHPFTPFLGQGCSQAFVDACVLGELLVRQDDLSFDQVTRAAQAYEKMRLVPANNLMLESRSTGMQMHSSWKSNLGNRLISWLPNSWIINFLYKSDALCDPDTLLGQPAPGGNDVVGGL